jgi:hypothetical protein
MRGLASLLATCAALVVAAAAATTSAAAGVELRDPATGKPCTPVARQSVIEATGGCVFTASAKNAGMTIVSGLGRFVFARCDVELSLRVDGRGRALIEGFGSFGRSPCYDIEACFVGPSTARGYTPLWKGRVRGAGNRLTLSLAACLDTCIGRFEGPLEIDVSRRGRGLRATTGVGAIGASGWGISDGVWNLRPDEADPSAASR